MSDNSFFLINTLLALFMALPAYSGVMDTLAPVPIHDFKPTAIETEFQKDITDPPRRYIRNQKLILTYWSKIRHMQKTGEISPEFEFNINRNHYRALRYSSPKKIGFFPVTGDPPKWGHIAMLLRAIISLKLDKIVIISQGYVPHKQASPQKHRFTMLDIVARILSPLVEFSDIGKGNNQSSLSHVLALYQMNPQSGWEGFYLAGDEYVERLPQDFSKVIHESHFSGIPPSLVFFTRTHTLNELNSLIEKIDTPFSLKGFYLPSFDSSTAVRTETSTLFNLPGSVLKYVQSHFLYHSVRTKVKGYIQKSA